MSLKSQTSSRMHAFKRTLSASGSLPDVPPRGRRRSRASAAMLAAATTAIATAACGSSPATSSGSPAAPAAKPLLKLLIGTPGVAADSTPTLSGPAGWALQEGKGQAILAKYGYVYGGDVGFNDGVFAAQALMAGSIQLAAIGGTPALEGKAQGETTRAIFASAEIGDIGFAAPLGGATSVSQLVGKTVGVGFGTIMDQYLYYVLGKLGLIGKVKLVNLADPADAYAALISHSIDAYVDSSSLIYEWVAKGHVQSIQEAATSYPDYASSDTVVVTQSFLDQHPNIQAAYWALYNEGQTLIKQNPNAYLAWSAKAAGVSLAIEKETADLSRDFQNAPITPTAVAAVQSTQQFLLSQKLIKAPVSISSWLVDPPAGSS